MSLLPAFLNVRGRSALVVGGGPVGQRRAATLLQAGAEVRLVCLEPAPEPVADRLSWIQEPYCSAHLDGVALVVAAAPHAINLEVHRDCCERGIPVNLSSEPELGDWMVPASAGLGTIQIAVSTGGDAPGLAAALCRRLSTQLNEELVWLVERIGDVRRRIRKDYPEDVRQTLMRTLGTIDWIQLLEESGIEGVQEHLRDVVGLAGDR